MKPVAERSLARRSRRRHGSPSPAEGSKAKSLPARLSLERRAAMRGDQLRRGGFARSTFEHHHTCATLAASTIGRSSVPAWTGALSRLLRFGGEAVKVASPLRRRTQHGKRRARGSGGAKPRPTTTSSEARRSMHAEIRPMRLFFSFHQRQRISGKSTGERRTARGTASTGRTARRSDRERRKRSTAESQSPLLR